MKIEGRNATIELLKSRRFVKKVSIEENINVDIKINEILKRAQNRGVFIQRLPKKKLDRLSDTGNHQGVLAEAQIDFESLKDIIAENIRHKKQNSFIYIREALHDDNIGAISRSAESAGINNLIITPKQPLTGAAFRSSAGALANIHIIRESLFNAIKICKQNLIKVVGIELDTDTFYYQEDLKGDIMLIIGGENRSLSSEILEKCDSIVKIPMHGKINSLNMSIAASIVIYDKIRQENI